MIDNRTLKEIREAFGKASSTPWFSSPLQSDERGYSYSTIGTSPGLHFEDMLGTLWSGEGDPTANGNLIRLLTRYGLEMLDEIERSRLPEGITDPELAAISICSRALEPLSPASRRRVFEYLSLRFPPSRSSAKL